MRERLDRCKVHLSENLFAAMRSLDESSAEIALVIDDEQRLVGTLTDGDVRRALLAGATLDTPLLPFVQRAFTSVTTLAQRAEVIDLMRARSIAQIPILDEGGHLVGLHLMHDMFGGRERGNWAVVMAGGRGTRLQPLTEAMPKPMLRVAGRPILERIILHLVGFGLRNIFLSISYLGHIIEQHFGDGSQLGCRIEYLREDRPLGTGGALSLLPEKPDQPLLVMNGDLVTQADVGAMLAFHEGGGQQATIGVRRYFHTVPFGCVETQGDRIVHMEEKPTVTRAINAGIYVLSPEVVARVAPDTELQLPTLVHQCLERAEIVRAFEIEDDWIDVGQREQLQRARGEDSL